MPGNTVVCFRTSFVVLPVCPPLCPPAGWPRSQLTYLAIPVCLGSVRDNGHSNSLQQTGGLGDCVTGKQPATLLGPSNTNQPNSQIKTGPSHHSPLTTHPSLIIPIFPSNLICPINLYAGCLTKTLIFNLIITLTFLSDRSGIEDL